jgi:hypothetical protein
VPWIVGELRIVSLGIQTPSYEDQASRQLGELCVERNGERQVGHRPTLVDRHLVRVLVHHPPKKVRSVLLGRLGGGLAFG